MPEAEGNPLSPTSSAVPSVVASLLLPSPWPNSLALFLLDRAPNHSTNITRPATRIKAATQIATRVLTGIGCCTEMLSFEEVEFDVDIEDVIVEFEVEGLDFWTCEPGRD